jgi:putative addiction module component (TIGR02574 family)
MDGALCRIMTPTLLRKGTSQMSSNLTEEAKKLPVDERIALVEKIWDSIAEENGCFELTDAQKQELDRRIQALQQNPNAGRTWEEIKSEFLNSK